MLEGRAPLIEPQALASLRLGPQQREMLGSIAALIDAVGYALTGDHERAQRSARIAVQALDAEMLGIASCCESV